MSTATTYPRIYREDALAARPAPARKKPVVVVPSEEEAILIRVVRATGANVLEVCEMIGASVRARRKG